MKVVFIASVYRHLSTFHTPYMNYLKESGYDVWAIANGKSDGKDVLVKNGFTCLDIPIERNPINLINLQAYKKLKRLFTQENFDLIHVHTPVAAFLARSAKRNIQVGKLIYTAHGFHFFKGSPIQNWIFYYPLEKTAAKWTDHLITINNEDYNRAIKMGYKKVHLLHGVGVEENIYEEEQKYDMKKQLGVPKESLVISYIAELNDNKNQIFLMRNWKRIKEQNPNVVLLLLGDGINKDRYNNYIESNQLKDIYLLGHRTDIQLILNITDIVCLLSYREGLPKSIMEAMINKIPCVVTNTRGLRDLISDNENGYIVDHNEDDELINKISYLLKNKLIRRKMGQNASKIIEPYKIDNVLSEYKLLYNSVLNNRSK